MTPAGVPTPVPEPGDVEARAKGSPLARAYKVIMFDWDGTAVASRTDDASVLAGILTELLAFGVWVVVVTGTNFANIDRQLCYLIPLRHRRRLVVCPNRGSEVYRFDRHGTPVRRYLRAATPAEEEALTRAAEAVRAALVRCTGLDVEVVHNRLNRRKIDLIPVPQWADPPKEAIGALLAAVDERLRGAGLIGGLAQAVALAREVARQHGLADARITSDAKHIEIGLTDKGDSVAWVRDHLLRRLRIDPADVLLAGDEFGPIGRLAGSDDCMRAAIPDAVTVSVGVEPTGVPDGVLYLGGGPARFRTLLLEQVRRHRLARLRRRARADRFLKALEPVHDPAWRLEQHGYVPALEHEYESRTAVSNGFLGVRGALEQPTAASHPGTYIAGLFDTVPTPYRMPVLVHAPDWLRLSISVNEVATSLEVDTATAFARTLDLRRGTLITRQALSGPDGNVVELRTLRLTSHATRAVALHVARVGVAQPAWVTLETVLAPPHDGLTLVTAADSVAVWRTIHEERYLAVGWETLVAKLGGARAPHVKQSPQERRWSWVAVPEEQALITRLATFARGDSAAEAVQAAQAALRRARRSGLRNLYRAHARVWARRWQEADIVLEGDAALQRALRFALYHLISAANPEDERVSIGARALTGEAYRGHVFWDTEIFILPFYIYTWPAAARALLMYRYHTLPAARAKAARLGYRGALYAWESTDTGEEATPPWVVAPDGTMIPIRNGTQELHISADVAYAVWQYWQATRDVSFLLQAGAEIILETARFWASRAGLEADGRYHIRGVIGPDEYHENVDDNAYTNVMARWNIERGLEVADLLARRWPERWTQLQDHLALTPAELAHWRDVAERLVTGACTNEGVIEQFRGYFELEPIDLAALAARPAPLDVVLGRERTQRSQVIKQADVVMLLALLWDRFPAPVREANFRFYEPRCGHGSSLSPPVHALVAARLGDTELAERYLAQTAAIDLEDSMGNVAGGVHVGALGGLWQAVVFGVLGFDPWSRVPQFEPHLPHAWQALRVPLRWRGRSLLVEVDQEPPRLTITLRSGRPLTVQVGTLRHRLERQRPWSCRWDADTRSWSEVAL